MAVFEMGGAASESEFWVSEESRSDGVGVLEEGS